MATKRKKLSDEEDNTNNTNSSDPPLEDKEVFEFAATTDLGRGLLDLYDEQQLIDVEFEVGPTNQKLSAHRIVLAAYSPYFKSMFTSSFQEALKLQKTISKPNVTYAAFSAVVRSCYTGQISIDGENVYEILAISNECMFEQVRVICETYLSKRISSGSVVGLLERAKLYNLDSLVKNCEQYIHEEGPNIFGVEWTVLCQNETFIDLLKRDSLPCYEWNFYEALVRLAKSRLQRQKVTENKEKHVQRMKQEMAEVAEYIRFPLLSGEDITDRLEVQGLISDKLIYEAYRFHTNPKIKIRESEKWKYTPRKTRLWSFQKKGTPVYHFSNQKANEKCLVDKLLMTAGIHYWQVTGAFSEPRTGFGIVSKDFDLKVYSTLGDGQSLGVYFRSEYATVVKGLACSTFQHRLRIGDLEVIGMKLDCENGIFTVDVNSTEIGRVVVPKQPYYAAFCFPNNFSVERDVPGSTSSAH